MLVEDDARVTLCNLIAIVTIEDGLTLVLFYLVEDGIGSLTVYYRRIQVDDHITIDVTGIVAAAINVTIPETTVFVISATCLRIFW